MEVAAPEAAPVRWLLDILSFGESASFGDRGTRLVTELAVVPTPRRARFLLPASSPKVAAASLTAYNRLRPRRVAATRSLLAVVVRFGGGAVLRHRVSVRTTAGDGSDELAERWLPEHLRRLLGVPRLHLAAGLSSAGPFAKPTLQLFDDRGRPLGYAKVGWTDATRAAVAREAEILRWWPRQSPVVTPAPLHAGHWHDRVLSITAPLPSQVRRVPVRRWPCVAGAREVAATASRGEHAIGGATWVPAALASVEALADHPSGTEAHDARARFEDLRDVDVPHGLAHGDWVRWNLAVDGATLVAWDWEHALDDAPLGFDLVHWAYQERVVLRGQRPTEGFAGGLEDALPHLTTLGLDRRQADAVAAAHRLRLITREADPAGAPPASGEDP